VLHKQAAARRPRRHAVEAPLDQLAPIKLDLTARFSLPLGIPELIKSRRLGHHMSSNVALMGVPGRDCHTAAKAASPRSTRSLRRLRALRVGSTRSRPRPTMTDRVKLWSPATRR